MADSIDCRCNCNPWCGCDCHKAQAEKLRTVESQLRWIPVSERLPGKFEHVLVYIKPVPEGPDWYPRTSYTLGWQKRGIWFGTFVDPFTAKVESGEMPDDLVTHWMSLPDGPVLAPQEAPKEKT